MFDNEKNCSLQTPPPHPPLPFFSWSRKQSQEETIAEDLVHTFVKRIFYKKCVISNIDEEAFSG
jgi:hypothetical protein